MKRDGAIVYLDIGEYVAGNDVPGKSVKTEDSVLQVPIHDKLIELGFDDYRAALTKLGQTQLSPDLIQNRTGKRTKEARRRMSRMVDRFVSPDRRLVFYSLRHAFKAKGTMPA